MKKLMVVLLLVGMISCAGCQTNDEYLDAYNNGYASGKAAGRTEAQEEVSTEFYNEGYEDGWQAGYDKGYGEGLDTGAESARTASYPEGTLILNKNSKKIHKPGCSGVASMKESNKIPTTESVESLIAQGYDPCDMCNPH